MKYSSSVIALIVSSCLAASLCVGLQSSNAWAARKYYPPGFTPPSATRVLPESGALQKTPAPSSYSPAPQVIIKTIRTRPKSQDPLVTLLNERRYYEALQLIDKRIRQSPQNIALHLTRGQILREKSNFEQAKTEYRLVLSRSKSKPLRTQALNGLGLTLYHQALEKKRLGEQTKYETLMKEAQSAYKQAMALMPKNPDALSGMAQMALTQNRLNDAETNLKKAVKYAPSDPQVLLTQGQLLLAQERPLEALSLVFKAKQKSPKEPRVPLILGQTFLAMERYDDAIIQLQQFLDQAPDNSQALLLLSSAYEHKMKPDDAEMLLQKAVSLNPADVETTLSLLKSYDQKHETERGTLLLKTLLKDQPNQLVYQQELLKRLVKMEQWDEAYETGGAFVNAMPLTPDKQNDDTEILLNLFVQAAFIKGKALLDRQEFLNSPVIQKINDYYSQRLAANPADLASRLNKLLLNPLAELPSSPKDFKPANADGPLLLQIAFLEGDWPQHQLYLQQMLQQVSTAPDMLQATAKQLLVLGDYQGAESLAGALQKSKPGNTEFVSLAQQISIQKRSADEQVRGLQMLPGKIPRNHWKNTAEEALRLGCGNWRLHATLADSLWNQKDYALALIHQKLTAQYAPNAQEKARWLKKFQKTEQRLEKAQK